jgi:hypothetical protein
MPAQASKRLRASRSGRSWSAWRRRSSNFRERFEFHYQSTRPRSDLRRTAGHGGTAG